MDDAPGPESDHLGHVNLGAAAALVRGLFDGGVRSAVLSPGSRSSPLALAAELCPGIETSVLPDERCAAFFALGAARGQRRPVLVVATSGTAPANWYPAIVEASMDAVPLIFVSADRPEELRRTGANQTVNQEQMFGGYPRGYFGLPAPPGPGDGLYTSTGRRASDRALWPRPGPVHVNFAFREPLLPRPAEIALDWPAVDVPGPQRPRLAPDDKAIDWLERRISAGSGVIVCGRADYSADFPGALVELADRLRCPVIADPLSGLRWGAHRRERITTAADLFLRSGANRPESDWILQFGGVPTSQAVQAWIAGHGAALIPVVPDGDWPDPSRQAALGLHGDPVAVVEAILKRDIAPAGDDWCESWRRLEQEARSLLDDPALKPPEADLVRAIESQTPDGASVFLGNSMPIRAFDAFAAGRKQAMTAFGNRGASGIDGCVSTIAGLGRCHPTLGLIGDLALYHDMNGLLAAAPVSAQLVVVQNGGGAIFGLLPAREHPQFERLWRTPTGLSCDRIAALYGLRHRVIESGDSMEQIGMIPDPGQGLELVEVRIDAEESWERHRKLWRAAAEL